MLLSEHFICPSVQFLSAGRFVSRNGTPHPRRCLPETVLLTGFAGEMSIRQEEREYTLRRGEYLLLQPQRIHVGTAPVSDGQSHFWCHFLPQTPPALPEYGQLPEPERFFVLFRQLIDTAYRGELSPPLRQSLCDRYTEILLCELAAANTAVPKADAHHRKRQVLVQAIREWIKENRRGDLSVQRCAAAFQYNPDYLTQLFKAETGEPLRHYMIGCRLQEAKRLLLNTDLHVAEIAYQVGFQDVKHFMKTFKQWESVTPSAYRQTHYRTHINTE